MRPLATLRLTLLRLRYAVAAANGPGSADPLRAHARALRSAM